MEHIRIRKLEAADADDIARIHAAIVRKPVALNFKTLIEKHAQNDDGVCFVAERNGSIIGFMISTVLAFGFGIDKSAWIASFGVDPDFMGQGIGERLAKEIFENYKRIGITRIHTTVRWDSTDLLSFFKAMGFDRSRFINLEKDI